MKLFQTILISIFPLRFKPRGSHHLSASRRKERREDRQTSFNSSLVLNSSANVGACTGGSITINGIEKKDVSLFDEPLVYGRL
jgi:hypothetical protein